MTVKWSTKTLEQRIQEERDRFTPETPVLPDTSRWANQIDAPLVTSFEAMRPQFQEPQDVVIRRQAPTTPGGLPQQPAIPKMATEKPTEEPIDLPFWQKSLQVFSAPFSWVDENLIKPGWGVAATTLGVLEDVPRLAGEDFFEWKKRSWAGWESPGIDINVPWSDESMRLDVRGVLEFAPWLLLPGAGKVGTGVRAGIGIAGALSKFVRVGRVLGRTIEFSPWGVVEKTAGAALKGAFKGAVAGGAKVSEAVGERVFGKYVPPPIPASVQKFTNYTRDVIKPARKEFQVAKKGLRTRQEQGVLDVIQGYEAGTVSYQELRHALDAAQKGGIKIEYSLTRKALAKRKNRAIMETEEKVARGEFSSAEGQRLINKINDSPEFSAVSFSRAEIKEMVDIIVQASESGFVRADSVRAFKNFMTIRTLPQEHNLRDWAKIFGNDFAKEVHEISKLSHSKFDQVLDFLNIGRSLQASIDLSATARQGLILGLLRPTQVPKWFGKQLKALVSEKWSYEIDDVMRTDPMFNEVLRATKAYIAPIRGATLGGAEELFASSIARRIPGIRRSERAFVTYINQARWETLKSGYAAMKAQGASEAEMELLGKFVDFASGRGRIPKSLEKFNHVFNATLFSPKLQAATMQLPRQIGRMLISQNPYMRKEAAKTLLTFVGGGVGLLSLLNATGNKVETDPRSGDFGKIKVGDTRLDIWRGYLQYTRFIAQMLTGERKSAYGNMNKAERSEVASRFLQSKSSPAFGLMADLLRGETFMGEPIFNDTTGFSRAAMQRVIPLAMQDIMDAVEQNGSNGALVAAPAMLGIGALTYVNNYIRVKNKIAEDEGFTSWDEIDPKTQREIENRNAELQAAQIDFDRQVMGTAWGDWRNAGQAIDDVFTHNVEQASAKFSASGNGIEYRDDITTAFAERRGGFAAREREDRFADIVKRNNITNTAEALVSLGPEQLAIKVYYDALFGEDMYDEFGDYRFDEARLRKEQLQQQLGAEMFDYVEEYQGLKFENLPAEFHELQEAKEIMKPYWAVREEVAKMFGVAFSESSRGQTMISKIRKGKRLTDPRMEAAYQRFYSR